MRIRRQNPGSYAPVCGKEAAPDAVFRENCGRKLL